MFSYYSESCLIGFYAPKLTKQAYLNIWIYDFVWILVESAKRPKFAQIFYGRQIKLFPETWKEPEKKKENSAMKKKQNVQQWW